MRYLRGTILAAGAAMAIAAHGAAMLDAEGRVTEKTPGWRFEASGAKGGAAFNPLEGWYPDKGGKLVSPRIAIPKAGAYYKLSFTGSAPVRSYEAVAFYDAAGNMIADNYDVIYGGEGTGKRYERVVFAQEGVKEAEVFFQSPKGCTVSDVKLEPASAEEAAKWCDSVYAKLPSLDFASVQEKLPPRTLDALKTGKPWRILMLGDSIMQDTFHSQFHALVKRAYPKSEVTWLVSVRGSTGCWYYCEPENFKKYVADFRPDCVFIGGISGWIHPDLPLNGGPAIESVAKRVNEELGAEVVVMTPTLAIDLRVPKGTEQGTAVAPSKLDHAALGDRAWKYDATAAKELKAICAKRGWPLWDMFTPAYEWLFKTGMPSEFYSRDYVHSGELGKQIIGRIALGYFTSASRLLTDGEAERIAREKLAKMTLEEKTSLCGLCATMYLNAIPRVGIDREWAFSDGSHGLKPEHNRDRWGYIGGIDDRSTSMPCMSALASTWNRSLAAKHGDVMGSQMRSRDKDQMLGPGLNIMRNPLCGRNWEYMSEDPFLISQMAVPLIQAAQAHGLACTPKHYCLNNQELNRFDTCSTVDSRALHEIYLPAFEAAVKGGALSLMTAYNRYNGTYCSENSYLQKALLREQWGFKGTIVTDWGGQHSCDNAVLNGGGMEANCGNKVTYLTDFYGTNGGDKYPLATAVKEGRVPEAAVDEMALRTLYVMAKTGFFSGTQDKGERLVERHREVARAIGEEAIILAKNNKSVLPLDKAKTKKLIVFGQIARLKQAEFGSSCECHVVEEISFLDGLKEYLGDGCEIAYYPLGGEVGETKKSADEGEKGYDIGGIVALTAAGKEPRVPLAELREECEKADAVLVFTGTTMGFGQAQETEGEDRPNMKSAPGHDEEIAQILSWKLPHTIVVCRAGSALELPWVGNCDTMLLTSYLGQEAGRPMAKVIFGDVNPSGKLTFSWPKCYADTPTGFFGERAYNATNSVYLEGVYVGYRWYEKRGIPVDFPFGHGLSYTAFEMKNEELRTRDDGEIGVRVDVTNVGERDGAEVVQLYVAPKDPKVDRPVKELKGFEKVFLKKGETKTVEFRLTPPDLAYWDAFAADFRADAGEYTIFIGGSSADTPVSADIVFTETLRPAPRPAPRPALAARLAEGPEIIGIVHWGLNTYTDREWGFGDEDPAMLNPAKFDADQIVGACKAGGIGGLVVVAKHHDGFCLWPTKTTEHNITKTKFRDGRGDYVKEMADACRKY
ncbi:MAG: glycoside hydrolase family 3 C-terminal domain-containing protein, partial [Kiritimatiellae bacterium]|nr:glycoside hydrolase family 3 C-terminal domain-containing protein [Kiritimatiellia bacterium]